MTAEDAVRLADIGQFLFLEARLLDDHRYADWEALWTDDGIYWVPANGDDGDPEQQMSIIYDNRSRIRLRVAQLGTGKRHAQLPQSRLRRLVSNVEIVGTDGGDTLVAANAMVFESHIRGDAVWASRNEYRLRQIDGQWRLARKKVVLVNNHTALFTMAFLM